MLNAIIELALFTAKSLIITLLILIILAVFFALIAKSKEKLKGRLFIKNLNKKYAETTEELLAEILPKKQFKQFLKKRKSEEKTKQTKTIYVLNFNGDIKASAVTSLRDEITAVLSVATPDDEVIVKVESPGGMVHGYG